MSTVMKFRKRPIIIEAILFDGSNGNEIRETLSSIPPPEGTIVTNPLREQLIVWTLEGPLVASKGDWIIRGIKGELYPCKPDIFEATYEELRP